MEKIILSVLIIGEITSPLTICWVTGYGTEENDMSHT